ncbi:protein-disulfide reductase DsbD family protein [Aurantiacibacter aquimixticola]|uniref:Thiol:disulfide interchange protein n=1 Tax=Aurantiacibacter aquimixticola TaxID=1958945 RepID=A0A419RQ35_9SPHN|nr:protein-disulfide reductase DsbD domain-containing protein [Aurantiacibacter aquimixticola]RJY07962.1 thiol:disulfide interchange protein [Aurantiacibacter aquimixticola]
MQASLSIVRYLLAIALLWASPLAAQQDSYMTVDWVTESAPQQGETLTTALRFSPREGWHGYWSNPGEAGLGMELDWQLPAGWEAGDPQYPVPSVLSYFGIANHAYKDDYTVLVPIEIGSQADAAPAQVTARYLVCSDTLCVPQEATLTLRYPQAGAALRSSFDEARAAIPPLIDSEARFAFTPQSLRVTIPLPETVAIGDPHLFIEQSGVVDYNAPQHFWRNGDSVIVEIPRGFEREEPGRIAGILSFGDGEGIRFAGAPGDVPVGGTPLGGAMADSPLILLLSGALLGGLLLNLMPCVFPILSLKALTLARAGASESSARREGLAYTAGVVLACVALGAAMLALRAAGEQVGWAFQLQQPLVVGALLVLATLITANLAGLFELPNLPIRSAGKSSAFATGLLAAVVATPCTGPFMAAALGAALLVPAEQALLLFAALGLGLALPFLLLGLIPALRSRLPQPGSWMESFRRWMAVPMGLTALALVWLAWRLGGTHFAFTALALGLLPVVALTAFRRGSRTVGWIGLAAALYFAASLPFRVDETASATTESVLDPIAYSEQTLADARASGAPVFVWFTADWCVTCKVNEQVAIEREATRAAFEEAGVVAMRGDWTRGDPAITRYLEQWGVAGVPLYVWYPAGSEGEQLPQVLTPDRLRELAES